MTRQILPQERHRIILARLAEEGQVLAAELSRDFGTSEDTIRRDLRDLAGAGRCERVYGGAVPLSPVPGPIAEREVQEPARKAALGRAAAALVRPSQVLFIDAGSTNLAIARALPENCGVTVATNAPAIAAALMQRAGVEVWIIGGKLDRRSGGACGARAHDEVRQIHADLCFLGACAVAVETGIAAFDPEEALLKRAMVAASEALVVAAVSDKLATRAPCLVAPVAAVHHLVVDHATSEAVTAPFAACGIQIHRAEAIADE